MVLVLRSSLIFVAVMLLMGCKQSKEVKSIESDAPFYFNKKTVTIDDVSTTQTATGIALIEINSKDDLKLRWRQIFNETPDDWSLYFCDNVACHFDLPDSVNLRSINKNSKKKKKQMKLFVTTNAAKGKGELKLELFDIRYPEKVDTVTYIINIE